MVNELVDKYGRKHDYLRISVTDRCNLRCVYCMGEDGVPSIDHNRILRYEEIVSVVEAAAQLGITRVRITGGEPLVRTGIENLVRSIAMIPAIQDISMTTNGILLDKKIRGLKEAGLNRINISLDSLKPDVYRQITRRGNLKDVLRGIRAALDYRLQPVKINVVLMKGINENEIDSFLRLAFEYPLQLRFIEYMPVDAHDEEWERKYLPLQAVLVRAAKQGLRLEPLENVGGSGPADMYRMSGALGAVGLIHPLSRQFCSKCNRLRLTSDGFIKPCLYWKEELSVRPALGNQDDLKAVLQKALDYKKEKHNMNGKSSGYQDSPVLRGMSMIGG